MSSINNIHCLRSESRGGDRKLFPPRPRGIFQTKSCSRARNGRRATSPVDEINARTVSRNVLSAFQQVADSLDYFSSPSKHRNRTRNDAPPTPSRDYCFCSETAAVVPAALPGTGINVPRDTTARLILAALRLFCDKTKFAGNGVDDWQRVVHPSVRAVVPGKLFRLVNRLRSMVTLSLTVIYTVEW